jgi:hypothetical protein
VGVARATRGRSCARCSADIVGKTEEFQIFWCIQNDRAISRKRSRGKRICPACPISCFDQSDNVPLGNLKPPKRLGSLRLPPLAEAVEEREDASGIAVHWRGRDRAADTASWPTQSSQPWSCSTRRDAHSTRRERRAGPPSTGATCVSLPTRRFVACLWCAATEYGGRSTLHTGSTRHGGRIPCRAQAEAE